MMIRTITLIILIGLAFIGSIQVLNFLQRRYLRLVAFYENLKKVFRIVNSGQQIIEVKIREPTKQEAAPNGAPQQMAVREVAEVPGAIREMDAEDVPESMEVSTPEEMTEETLFISLDMEGREYSSSEELTPDELVLMGNTLSNRNASMEDKIAASQTLCKIRHTEILTALGAVAAQQIKALVADVMPPTKIVPKEGDFDYSQYIKT
jgi:hypothetical protein